MNAKQLTDGFFNSICDGNYKNEKGWIIPHANRNNIEISKNIDHGYSYKFKDSDGEYVRGSIFTENQFYEIFQQFELKNKDLFK